MPRAQSADSDFFIVRRTHRSAIRTAGLKGSIATARFISSSAYAKRSVGNRNQSVRPTRIIGEAGSISRALAKCSSAAFQLYS